MKYIIIDCKNGDIFCEAFDTNDAAIKKADYEWSGMSDYDKNIRDAYYVIEAESEDDIEGNVVKEYK